MKQNLRRQLNARKRRTRARIDPANGKASSPAIQTPPVKYQLAQRQQAIAAGGLGVLTQLVGTLDLRREINAALPLLKCHLPYDEADHVLNIALNLLAGGTCLDHLEDRRQDEAYLNALGAQRIPDPTTAGDFCRRFSPQNINDLMDATNRVRRRVWKQQPEEFFDLAIVEGDGTQVQTAGEKKQGIGMNHKSQWGYHPLVVTLANTREPLFIANRSGNRPSHEGAAGHFDRSVTLCREAGFRNVRLRGDTDFALTKRLDGWDDDNVQFVFGYDAMPKLKALAAELPQTAWEPLLRRRGNASASGQTRARRPGHKEAIVVEKQYRNQRLMGEQVAEFDYRPTKCDRAYRMVVVRKEIQITRGQQRLFEEEKDRCFFFITNVPAEDLAAREIVRESNQRCDQENHIAQLKQCALVAPLSDLNSNWAYMVMASLAWSLKAWSALLIRPRGRPGQRARQSEQKRRLLAMDFTGFRDRVVQVPAQIIRHGGQLIYRLLSYRPGVELMLLCHEQLHRPLRI